MHTQYSNIHAYITKDGSQIRELMHPSEHNNKSQSLAEARIPVAEKTQLHKHLLSEELYHVTSGQGQMTLGGEFFAIGPGDTIAIAPGTAHCVENTGTAELVILCCCSPAYSDEDTQLIDQQD